ncbi:MAG: cyanophycinase, partial [Woeseiaceae bacterium]
MTNGSEHWNDTLMQMDRTLLRTPIGIFFGLLVAGCGSEPPATSYDYYITGDPADVVTETRGLLVLQGGGDDVDINYSRMGEFAGGGDFVVLRASGEDDYNEYIFKLCQCDSVETIVFGNRDAAFDDFVIGKIRDAEALFIAGGDQSNYVRFWRGTPVEDAIHTVAAKPAPIGGTSAGMAIMGEFSYSAMSSESLTAEAGLSDPFHADLTLENEFLRFAGLENVITDQHLVERDRIGRTVAMLARLVNDGWTPQARAIAADRETSVHVNPASGNAEVFSTADHETPYVYFLSTTGNGAVCEPGMPLTLRGVAVRRLSPGDTFNMRHWTSNDGIQYTLDVIDGVLASSRSEI